VPLPHALDQDQFANAGVLEQAGGALRIAQNTFTPRRLADEIAALAAAPARLQAMAAAARSVGRLDAADRLADLVLKVAFRFSGGEERDEAAGLRVWDGNGTVRLHAACQTESAYALLLERCLPGTPLGQVLPGPEQHGDNILAAQREPWLVIDPKPYVGDPAYDLLQHMLNCEDRLAADPAGLVGRMAGLAGIDGHRARQWLFARSVQESIGSPLMRQVATRLAPA
jgi:hypothetical protein